MLSKLAMSIHFYSRDIHRNNIVVYNSIATVLVLIFSFFHVYCQVTSFQFNSNNNQASVVVKSYSTDQNSNINEPNLISFASILNGSVKFNISSNDVFVHLHIQKTSGKSFNKHLVNDLSRGGLFSCDCKLDSNCRCLRPGIKQLTANQVIDTWLISRLSTGWVCGLHPSWTEIMQCLTGAHKFYLLTLIRNPVHRLVSEYKHAMRGATWKASKKFCSNNESHSCHLDSYASNKTIEDFIDCPNNSANNRQTRMLADLKKANCSSSNYGKTILNSAKEHLEQMSFFGLCEYQRASQLVFEKTFNVTFLAEFVQSNDTKTIQTVNSLPTSTVSKIKAANDLDMQLYAFALDLFSKRCRKLGLNCTSS